MPRGYYVPFWEIWSMQKSVAWWFWLIWAQKLTSCHCFAFFLGSGIPIIPLYLLVLLGRGTTQDIECDRRSSGNHGTWDEHGKLEWVIPLPYSELGAVMDDTNTLWQDLMVTPGFFSNGVPEGNTTAHKISPSKLQIKITSECLIDNTISQIKIANLWLPLS